ncbi:MAG: ABC transporter ATP-binding protein [Synechocystis sp.]
MCIRDRYVIGHQAEGASYVALREVLAEGAKSLVRRFPGRGGSQRETREEFWELKEVSMEVKRGECVGIIGRNGAGKSTLLKILSRITEPTTGRIELNGRVASLLEVGTGFHPELTGRENIYLNGAILGMSRREIKAKFDEIVDFAEVEKFLDTPVKRYSSGMYVRLAFAVAAYLEPEILVVDEVLAVGDAAFQKKCLGKMGDVATKEGRTVLFVSHNMAMITSLCQQAILLNRGNLIKKGLVSDTITFYFTEGNHSSSAIDFSKSHKKIGDQYVTLLGGYIRDCAQNILTEVPIEQSFKICMHYRVLNHNKIKFIPNFHIYKSDGVCVFVSSPPEMEEIQLEGDYVAECYIPDNFLNDGTYFVGLAISSFGSGVTVHFYEQNALCFNVKDSLEATVATRQYGYVGPVPGVIRPTLQWRIVTNKEVVAA